MAAESVDATSATTARVATQACTTAAADTGSAVRGPMAYPTESARISRTACPASEGVTAPTGGAP